VGQVPSRFRRYLFIAYNPVLASYLRCSLVVGTPSWWMTQLMDLLRGDFHALDHDRTT
jgi:hypothetical protein